MSRSERVLLLTLLFILLALVFTAAPVFAQRTYVTEFAANKVHYMNPMMGSSADILVPGNPYDVTITDDGLTAYVTCYTGNTVAVVDVLTNTVTGYIQTPFAPTRLDVDNGGTRLYVTNQMSQAVTPGPDVTIVNIAKNKLGVRANKVVGTITLGTYVPGADSAYAVRAFQNAATAPPLFSRS